MKYFWFEISRKLKINNGSKWIKIIRKVEMKFFSLWNFDEFNEVYNMAQKKWEK